MESFRNNINKEVKEKGITDIIMNYFTNSPKFEYIKTNLKIVLISLLKNNKDKSRGLLIWHSSMREYFKSMKGNEIEVILDEIIDKNVSYDTDEILMSDIRVSRKCYSSYFNSYSQNVEMYITYEKKIFKVSYIIKYKKRTLGRYIKKSLRHFDCL